MTSVVFRFRQNHHERERPELVTAARGTSAGARFVLFRLLPNPDPGESSESWSLDDRPGLCMRFMRVRDEDGLLAFARENGVFYPNFATLGDFDLPDGAAYINRVEIVLDEARRMEEAWDLWRAIARRDMPSLRLLVRSFRPRQRDMPEWIRLRPVSERLARWFAERDTTKYRPSEEEGVELSDEDLFVRCSALFTEILEMALAPRLRTRFIDRRGQQPEIAQVPENLLAAMWLQLHAATSGAAHFPECWGCGRPFEVSKIGKRRQAHFEDERCKSRFERLKPQIRQRAKDGAPPEQIAAELGVPVTGVASFIAKKGLAADVESSGGKK